MTKDEIQAALNAEHRSRDSLAQFLGYWLLQNKDGVYRAISKLRYMRTSPISEEEQRAAESQIDRLSHEWNRTSCTYRMQTKRIDELRAALKAAR